MGFFEMYTNNLTFPFEKSKYPLIKKLNFIQDLMVVKNIDLTSHLFNAIPSIMKIWHFFQGRFCSKEEKYKNVRSICLKMLATLFCQVV